MTPPPARASVKDVAAVAGVSLGTVSNVLNRPDRVSPATRAKVERAMLELGFIRNESARQLRAGRSRTLAYVLLDARNPFFTDVAEGVEICAEQHDLRMFLCHSDNRLAREADYLAHLVEQRVQGILITPVDPESQSLEDTRRAGVPIVIVDRIRSGEQFCSVAVDDVHGGRLAVEHLVDLGHERIAYIGGPDSIGQVRDRWQGACAAWAEAGRPPEALTILATAALTVREGAAAGERLLGIPAKRRPTAAFCANDLVAMGLLQQLTSAGVSVPHDFGIVGYDDIEYAAAAAVPLTSVRQPRQELGKRATELVLDEAHDPDHTHEQVVFTPELVARASTRR